ncbi:MAG: GIY-YIG nuclease family protein [Colwellia sp.]|nr:GIY-YIG nuclease family protein [Colwellia sp.]
MKKGYAYIARVNGRNDLFKVGFTCDSPEVRVSALKRDYPNMTFELVRFYESNRPKAMENFAHEILKNYRFEREVFNCTLNQAESAVLEFKKGRYTVVNSFDDAIKFVYLVDIEMCNYAQKNKGIFTYLTKKYVEQNRVIKHLNFNPEDFKAYIEEKVR